MIPMTRLSIVDVCFGYNIHLTLPSHRFWLRKYSLFNQPSTYISLLLYYSIAYPTIMICRAIAFLLLGTTTTVLGFTPSRPVATSYTSHSSQLFSSNQNDYLSNLSQQQQSDFSAEPQRNPDRPELPAIPGDYDWDAKYAGDADWMVGDQVPGKRTLNEIEIAQQVTALSALEDKWRKEREYAEYEESKNVGFVPTAELINGRTAMFFLVTGLLTEYWTGISLPGQVEEMLRIAGVIGFEG